MDHRCSKQPSILGVAGESPKNRQRQGAVGTCYGSQGSLLAEQSRMNTFAPKDDSIGRLWIPSRGALAH
jgi:hypothetical protein